MYSMTGYGKGTYKNENAEVSCEIRTVNNRYLDLSLKMPRQFFAYEAELKELVKEKITRGHAEIGVVYKDKRDKSVSFSVNLPLAKAYAKAAGELKTAVPEAENDLTVSALLRLPDVLSAEESEEDEHAIDAVKEALQAALVNLNAMREKEGEKLKADMLSRVDTVERLVGDIAVRAPLVAEDYRKKLKVRIEEALNGAAYDETRLLTEVAVFTDKCNIDEELTRLRSHIAQFRAICEEKVVGRKLDFLVQEFNREANTSCSKSNDALLTKTGLALKNEIEKIREQVQNVE